MLVDDSVPSATPVSLREIAVLSLSFLPLKSTTSPSRSLATVMSLPAADCCTRPTEPLLMLFTVFCRFVMLVVVDDRLPSAVVRRVLVLAKSLLVLARPWFVA
ncbi:hypothetical protein LMG10661_03805 [Ralstonia syzygii subsp. syzygii]|nr:hypothetical protein LMG10661_03805 [Ralstonia syzygii subsp. syzygii]